MKRIINIQSISDIITNSSSEVFCKIHSEDKDVVDILYDLFETVYGWNQESEITPVLDYGIDDDFKPWEYDNYEDECKAREAAVDKTTITIEMPYSYRKVLAYHRAGIDATIDKVKKEHPDSKIEVEYNEDF